MSDGPKTPRTIHGNTVRPAASLPVRPPETHSATRPAAQLPVPPTKK
jgi:hypothetical protein